MEWSVGRDGEFSFYLDRRLGQRIGHAGKAEEGELAFVREGHIGDFFEGLGGEWWLFGRGMGGGEGGGGGGIDGGGIGRHGCWRNA